MTTDVDIMQSFDFGAVTGTSTRLTYQFLPGMTITETPRTSQWIHGQNFGMSLVGSVPAHQAVWSGSSPHVFQRPEGDVEEIFTRLAEEWRATTAIQSSIQRKVLDRSYQRIIGLGPRVVPLILRDLQKSPDHWFWALTAIVGEDVAAGQTTMAGAADAWLVWGRVKGILSE